MAARRGWLLLALAALSGASGLTFELIWVRQASLLLGHTAAALSTVVAAFLGGLGLGALALGRRVDAARRPLSVYGALECVTAAAAFALTLALPRMPGWLEAVGLAGGGPWPARAALAVALVLVPAAAMGGTLPALVRAAVELEGGSAGKRFGAIYAVNTLGAAAGCLGAGFVALGALGIARTGMLAALGNLVAGAVALAWSRREASAAASSAAGPFEPTAGSPRGAPELDRRALALAAASGFAALSLEVLWFRSLASALDSTSYALSLLLSVYLAGLVLGSWLFARRPPPAELLRRFGEVELLFAFAALGSLLLLGQLRALEHLVPLGDAPAQAPVAMALRAAAVLLVPCALSGYALPLLVEASSAAAGAATRSGRIYGANTAGGIAGSLLTGLWLVPRLGTQPAFAVACAAAAFAALGAARARAVLAGAAALAFATPAVAQTLAADASGNVYVLTPTQQST
ncbi:MAG TPA: hypothetical protein VND93_23470, partial [Myxococcales bacterium]|nr:hypothetical protein [Myxococcales bacterium]